MNGPALKHCLNCGEHIEGKFCSQCGQKTQFDRVSLAFIWHEIFHFFTHIENGFLFTTWRLLVNPGEVCLHYINGKRKRYQSPVSYFLIWTSIFVLTFYLFTKIFGEEAVISHQDYFGKGTTTPLAISNLTFILAFIIPLQSLYVYLFITKNKYTYIETLVMMVYVIGTVIFLQFVFALIALAMFIISDKPVGLQYSDVFKAAYLIWFIISLLHNHDRKQKILRGIVTMIFITITFSVWRLIAVPWVVERFFQQ